MKAITAAKMKEIDRAAIQDFGIPSLILMENAGSRAADVALGMLPEKNKRIVCVCGKGNNGGDGFVCARHLINAGRDVDIFLTGEASHLNGDTKTNFLILEKMGAAIYNLRGEDSLKNLKYCLDKADLIIDAIFGIGISGKVKKPYSEIIKIINESRKKVLAVDLPSGLDADKGILLGSCIRADKTVTFAAPKTGLLKKQGVEICGEVIVADISIPKQLLD